MKNSTEEIDNIAVHKFVLKDNSTNETKITHLFFDKYSTSYHIHSREKYDVKAIKTIIREL